LLNNKVELLLRWLILLSLATGLSACGFHLRGAVEVPTALKETRIIGIAEFAPLGLQLKKVLTSAGSKVLPATAKTTSTITISNELYKRRVLSVDAQGRVAEYELIYSFYFQVSGEEGAALVPNQKIELTRDFRFDPNNVLAKDAEEAQIRTDLIGFAVRQLMRRINTTLKQKS
jgi:LPS-assembly lipoprotein